MDDGKNWVVTHKSKLDDLNIDYVDPDDKELIYRFLDIYAKHKSFAGASSLVGKTERAFNNLFNENPWWEVKLRAAEYIHLENQLDDYKRTFIVHKETIEEILDHETGKIDPKTGKKDINTMEVIGLKRKLEKIENPKAVELYHSRIPKDRDYVAKEFAAKAIDAVDSNEIKEENTVNNFKNLIDDILAVTHDKDKSAVLDVTKKHIKQFTSFKGDE